MDAVRRVSTSHSCVRETTAELLLERIRNAVDSTVKDVPNVDEREARCFLAKHDLDEILEPISLAQLLKELIEEHPDVIRSVASPAHPTNGLERDRNVSASDTDNHVTDCVRATTGPPSRTALLALFLYQDRRPLLLTFVQWLMSGHDDIPSDDSMPFTPQTLDHHGVDERYQREIIRHQAIFRPVTIRKREDRELEAIDRLPFIGPQTNIKNGSSGTVMHTTIARKHWEIESDGNFVPGNPDSSTVVALKTFKEIPTVRNMEEATNDFTIERRILQELRSCNIKHNMIVLDWGSITIFDEAEKPISHSLVFELATFSLTDFLKDERRARTYTTKSLLLARLVDIVEALACLHDSLKTLHLDIKPDNILVFEKGSSHSDNRNQDQHEVILKLSDFGLARKMGARQRTGHNRIDLSDQPSRSSATPATRPAGTYQGPEIQERNSGQAGRGSDVWSIGCVALMVLAFVTNGPTEVSKLTSRLPVDFLYGGGCQSLFYIRSDSHPWEDGDVKHYRCQYLENFNPVIGHIPGTQPRLQAAVNPQVISWSNVLYHSYRHQPEQRLIQGWFEVLFRSVLRIDHTERLRAAELRDKLRVIQQQWKSVEENPDVAGEEPKTVTSPLPNQVNDAPRSSQTPNIAPKTTLCSAIKDDDASAVRNELDSNPEQLKHHCPGSNTYPIHCALLNQSYRALDVLLDKSDPDITELVCGGRTALQLACSQSGDTKALRSIGRQHDKFRFPQNVYEENKKGLGKDARRVFDDLYKTAHPQHRKWGKMFGL